MYCLDTNVWVYYLDADLPEHEAVHEAVSDLLRSEPLFTTTVLQMEVVHYVSNQLKDSKPVIEGFLTAEGATTDSLSPDDVERAALILHEHQNSGLGGRDASVLAAIEEHDVTELWTHDSALKAVAHESVDVSVYDPVEGTYFSEK